MSSTVKSYGFVAVLDKPLTEEEEREELSETLYNNKSGLNINYEGTLVYIDFNQHQPYDVREDIYGLTLGDTTFNGRNKFYEALEGNGLTIIGGTVQPYEEIWYNGGDSMLDTLTVEDYIKAITIKE